MSNPVVLFDGVCLLCNGMVRFIIANDPCAIFRFAALQSGTADQLWAPSHNEKESGDSIVLIEDGKPFVRSDAVLRILRRLRMPWPLFTILSVIPKPIRDACYRFVARNRYRWFGRSEHCMIPTENQRARFLA